MHTHMYCKYMYIRTQTLANIHRHTYIHAHSTSRHIFWLRITRDPIGSLHFPSRLALQDCLLLEPLLSKWKPFVGSVNISITRRFSPRQYDTRGVQSTSTVKELRKHAKFGKIFFIISSGRAVVATLCFPLPFHCFRFQVILINSRPGITHLHRLC